VLRLTILAVPFAAFALWAATSVLSELSPPIAGMTAANVRDMFNEIHNGHPHEAVDIMKPRGTPVHAVVSGVVRKLFLSKPGGITVYQFDDAGVYCYYYAHLDRYADGLKEGARIAKGDVVGYVGSTGNARPGSPHLHFAIFQLGPEKLWWKGRAIDPYPALIAAVNKEH
jgi:murein DD-endopeptidase MepM/ murein hydrolase activator NlpD